MNPRNVERLRLSLHNRRENESFNFIGSWFEVYSNNPKNGPFCAKPRKGWGPFLKDDTFPCFFPRFDERTWNRGNAASAPVKRPKPLYHKDAKLHRYRGNNVCAIALTRRLLFSAVCLRCLYRSLRISNAISFNTRWRFLIAPILGARPSALVEGIPKIGQSLTRD